MSIFDGLQRQKSPETVNIEEHLLSDHDFTRMISADVKEDIKAPVGSTYARSVAIIYALNMVLGTGPLTMPYAFAQSGFLLGSVFLLSCAALGYITSTYVIETLAVVNATIFEKAELKTLRRPDSGLNLAGLNDEKTKQKVVNSMRRVLPGKVFRIRERTEIADMSERLLPNWLKNLCCGFLLMYTAGTLCVYAVTVTTSMEVLIPVTHVLGMGKHEFVVLAFMAVVMPLCLANLQKLKAVQKVVMVFRLAAVVTMIGASLLTIGSNTIQEVPMVNVKGIPALYSNAVLAFMVHHSLPGVLSPLEPQADARKVIGVAYLISYAIYLVLALAALCAFGTQVPALYNLAFSAGVPYVLTQFLTAYPLTIFSVFPIVGITLRNSLLIVLHFDPPNPDKMEVKDYLATAAVTVVPSAVAYLTHDVQAIVRFFSGYFGLSLMLVVPSVLVRYARQRLVENPDVDFDLKSPCLAAPFLAAVALSWTCAMVLNTYTLMN